jgi:hypothetical protein
MRNSKAKAPKKNGKPAVYHNIVEDNKGGKSQRVRGGSIGSSLEDEDQNMRESESHVNPMPSEMEDN